MHDTKKEECVGYYNYSCIHYFEEYISADGGLSFDFTGDEIIDHYCNLGHSLSYGSYCRYYEKRSLSSDSD